MGGAAWGRVYAADSAATASAACTSATTAAAVFTVATAVATAAAAAAAAATAHTDSHTWLAPSTACFSGGSAAEYPHRHPRRRGLCVRTRTWRGPVAGYMAGSFMGSEAGIHNLSTLCSRSPLHRQPPDSCRLPPPPPPPAACTYLVVYYGLYIMVCPCCRPCCSPPNCLRCPRCPRCLCCPSCPCRDFAASAW